MATVAGAPTRWTAAHWASAIALSSFAIAGLIVLTAGSRLTRHWGTMSAWAVLIVGALEVTTAAVGFVLAVGLGIAPGGPVRLVATTVMGPWTLWFGVALTRSRGVARIRPEPEEPDPGGRDTVH